ncbi:MAG: alpha-amylase/4-alpha-glucanotransferase domain-containing protein [Candidatus Omnitrophota bacterium]
MKAKNANISCAEKTLFAMIFHCCQPVFNFEHEIEKAYRRAYLPLLKVLSDYPGIKFSFHFSGNMLEWLESRYPSYIENLKVLLRQGRVEIIGGGCYDPIMSIIPGSDRLEQLELNNKIISRIFGIKSRGAWLGERVWDPSLVDTLQKAGMEYVILDDYHVLRSGIKKENIFRLWKTRGEKGTVVAFPSLTYLRYSMPFRAPKETVSYIKSNADNIRGNRCFVFADDGEKFGAWPRTYQWVYERRWLAKFLAMLTDNSDWLRTVTCSEAMEDVCFGDAGVISSASYCEMMNWSGGDFNNFLKKYPETERMRQRQLLISNMLRDELENKNKSDYQAKKELLKSQAGCAYWHGTFGGIYLPHLRSGVYEHLINSKNIIDRSSEKNDFAIHYFKQFLENANSETVFENTLVSVFVDPKGGAITEFDYKPLKINLINTIARKKESYHKKLEKDYASRVRKARMSFLRGDFTDIHDVLGVKDRGLKKILEYDDHKRNSFMTHIFGNNKVFGKRSGYENFLEGEYKSGINENKSFVTQLFSQKGYIAERNKEKIEIEVIKEITVCSGPDVMCFHRILKRSKGETLLRYGIEFNFLIWDNRVLPGPRHRNTDKFILKDKYSGFCLEFFLSKKAPIYMYPLYSVNETEKGLAKTFQGVSILIGGRKLFSDTIDKEDMYITFAVRNNV